MPQRFHRVMLLVVLVMPSVASAQGLVNAERTGTHSVTTGNRGDSGVTVVKIESGGGPYRRTKLGTGWGLLPRSIAYLGSKLGLPESLYPKELVVEFCEYERINEALLKARCPTQTWTLNSTVKYNANYESINRDDAGARWFVPGKPYVLIWLDGDKVIRYSTPVTFARQ